MASQERPRLSIMFVCLGNICRSPMAQAVFQHLIHEKGLEAHFDRIESAGTGAYHVGNDPDERTVAKCQEKGIPISSIAQAIEDKHYRDFDYLIGMDANNVRNLQAMKPRQCHAQIKLFGEYGDGKPIQDPYYGGRSGFETTYKQVLAYSEGLLESLNLPTQKPE